MSSIGKSVRQKVNSWLPRAGKEERMGSDYLWQQGFF